ncbi:hypothetical protein FQN55_006051 [Onygenales sp. PD_40]|nr:hypothetical protein FQN55_006051 [Onygenales sp. PD_40]
MASRGPPTFAEWLQGLVDPGVLGSMAAYHYIAVLLETVFRRGQILAPILRGQQIRDEAFSNFWIKFSGARAPPSDAPRVGSSALLPALLATADGVVLDIGPGTGSQSELFTNPNLRKMYGAEPCLGLHADLNAKIQACGLGSKYQILPCSAERKTLVPALAEQGLLKTTRKKTKKKPDGKEEVVEVEGIFDTIVCVRVLCSVPNPRETIAGLYSLLKPGGKMLVCEHVVNPFWAGTRGMRKGSFGARFMQFVYTWLGWSFFMGDCHLNRDTERMLLEAAGREGGWEKVDVERWFEWSTLPYLSGTLVKRG